MCSAFRMIRKADREGSWVGQREEELLNNKYSQDNLNCDPTVLPPVWSRNGGRRPWYAVGNSSFLTLLRNCLDVRFPAKVFGGRSLNLTLAAVPVC